MAIESTVEHLEPQRCLRWTGPAVGEGLRIDNGVHVWTLTEIDRGVLTSTEESWAEAQVEADSPTSTAYLGASLDGWLADLKNAAEATARDRGTSPADRTSRSPLAAAQHLLGGPHPGFHGTIEKAPMKNRGVLTGK